MMNEKLYETVANVFGYWFDFLAAIILWRSLLWLRKDASRLARVKTALPDAGFIGEWAVIAAEGEDMQVDTVIPATRDGWIGSARACDIRLKSREVPARVARYYLRSDGLHVLPKHRSAVEVDGMPVQKEAVLRHGATLATGGVTLQLRLFAGVILEGETPSRRTRERGATQPGVLENVDIEKTKTAEAMKNAEETPKTVTGTVLPKPVMTVPKRWNRSKTSGTQSP